MSRRLVAILALCLPLALPLSAPAFGQAAAKAAPAADAGAKPKKAPSAKQLAAREHMKACGAEWRDMKAKGTTKNQTWREFSKVCLSRKG